MRKLIVVLSVSLLPLASLVLVALLFLRMPRDKVAVPAAPTAAITQLTNSSSTDLRPVWSPDNHWIAFESDRNGGIFHIYVMRPDGSGLRALTSGKSDDRRPVWTPDSATLLYDSSDGTVAEIWSVNVSSGSRKQVTRVGGQASFANTSPDGKQITFYVYKDEMLDLWIANTDGSQAHPLTHTLASTENEQCTFACHQAAWSPDGQHIAYTGGDGKSIWMMRADGSEAQSIIADEDTNHFPWFLPDGRLAYITEYVPPQYGAAWTDAHTYNLKTGEHGTLLEFMSMQGPVDWSNDDSLVLFHSPRSGHFSTYLVNLNAPDGLAAIRGTPVPGE